MGAIEQLRASHQGATSEFAPLVLRRTAHHAELLKKKRSNDMHGSPVSKKADGDLAFADSKGGVLRASGDWLISSARFLLPRGKGLFLFKSYHKYALLSILLTRPAF